jgi:hypothetical protein
VTSVPPHTHPEYRRLQRWVLVAIVILAVATFVGLTRLQHLTNEDRETSHKSCQLSIDNRTLIRDVLLDTKNIPGISVAVMDHLTVLEARADKLVQDTIKNCPTK